MGFQVLAYIINQGILKRKQKEEFYNPQLSTPLTLSSLFFSATLSHRMFGFSLGLFFFLIKTKEDFLEVTKRLFLFNC